MPLPRLEPPPSNAPAPHARPGRRKRILLVMASILLAAAIVETAARVAVRARPELVARRSMENTGFVNLALDADPHLLWRLRPGPFSELGVLVRVNNLGLRGPDIDIENPEGRYRVLFLGDSSTYGFGVEEGEAYPFRLGAALGARLGRPVDIVNGAVPGYSSTQCRIQAERLLPLVRPDVVVVAPLWSDMMPSEWSDNELFERLTGYGEAYTSRIRKRLRGAAAFRLLEALIESHKPLPADRKLLWQKVFEGSSDLLSPRVMFTQYRDNLRAIGGLAASHDSRIVWVVPDGHPASGEPGPPRIYFDLWADGMRDTAREFGDALVEVPKAFASAPGGRDGLFIDSVHPSPAGHAIIALGLAEAWERCRIASGAAPTDGEAPSDAVTCFTPPKHLN